MSSFSNWREDLREIVDSDSEDQNEKEIKEKKVKNKIDINPSIRESIESIGGQLIDIREISEGKCDDCTCEGCGPDGVGHQNPCIECGGHHKEETVDEALVSRRTKDWPKGSIDPSSTKERLAGDLYDLEKQDKRAAWTVAQLRAKKKKMKEDYSDREMLAVTKGQGKPMSKEMRARADAALAHHDAMRKKQKEARGVKEEVVDEAKVDTGKSDAEKATARNKRNTPPGANKKFDTSVFITRKTGESLGSARSRKRVEAHKKKQDAARVAKSKERATGTLRKYDADGDGKVRVIDAGYKPEGQLVESVAAGIALSPQELQIQRKKAQLDVRLAKKRQQSMNKIEKDSIDVEKQAKDVDVQEKVLDKFETGEKERIVKGMKKSSKDLKKRYGDKWKNVMYATATKRAKEAGDTSMSDKRYAAEDRAFDNVVSALRAKHGKDAVLTKDSPKPKAQSRPKAKPDTRTPEQKKSDQEQANIDARYGGRANRLAGRGLGT